MRLIYLCVAVLLAGGLAACQQENPAPKKAEVKHETALETKSEAPAKTVENMIEEPVEKSVEVAKEKVEAAVVATANVTEKVAAEVQESVVEEAPTIVKQATVSPTSEVSGDAVKGAKIAKGKCGACHYFDKDRKKMGPSLMGVFGRAPSIDGVPFATWDAASLDEWLTDPKAVKSNTKMSFKGLDEKGKRDDIIAYLKTL